MSIVLTFSSLWGEVEAIFLQVKYPLCNSLSLQLHPLYKRAVQLIKKNARVLSPFSVQVNYSDLCSTRLKECRTANSLHPTARFTILFWVQYLLLTETLAGPGKCWWSCHEEGAFHILLGSGVRHEQLKQVTALSDKHTAGAIIHPENKGKADHSIYWS